LRKEAGAIVATEAGIYAASRFLRHANIELTAQHYADQKRRISVDMGALLPPANVVSIEKTPKNTRSHLEKMVTEKIAKNSAKIHSLHKSNG
jgi:hypothetical protein